MKFLSSIITIACFFTIILIVTFFGCSKNDKPPVFYEVTAFDSSTGQYTLVRVDNTTNKRIEYVLVCNFYKWGNHERVDGPHSCDLSVGQILIPNPLPKNSSEFVDIWQLGETFFIMVGSDSNRVQQQFTIKSARQSQ